jgi:tripartite-type tricarboxylate transporter receptor subunit TctC
LAGCKAKQVRALGQFGEKRLINFEDTPTFKELGYKVVFTNWYKLIGSKGMPTPIVAKSRTLMKQVPSDHAIVDFIGKAGD